MFKGWKENVKVWDRILSNMCFRLSVGSFAIQRTNQEGATVRPSKEMELFSVRGHLFAPWLPLSWTRCPLTVMGMMVLKLTLEIFAFTLWRCRYWLMGFLLSRGSSCRGEAAELEKSENEAVRGFQTVAEGVIESR